MCKQNPKNQGSQGHRKNHGNQKSLESLWNRVSLESQGSPTKMEAPHPASAGKAAVAVAGVAAKTGVADVAAAGVAGTRRAVVLRRVAVGNKCFAGLLKSYKAIQQFNNTAIQQYNS